MRHNTYILHLPHLDLKLIASILILGIFFLSGFVISADAVNYKTFTHVDGIFSIDYPSDWRVDYNETSMVVFEDKENWFKYIQVYYFEDVYYNELTESEIFDDIKAVSESYCYDSTFEIDGYICYDFQIFETLTSTINGLPSYEQLSSYTKEYAAVGETEIIWAYEANVVDKNDLWELSSEIRVKNMSQSRATEVLDSIYGSMGTFVVHDKSSAHTSLSNLPALEYYYSVEPVPEWADQYFYETAVKDAVNKITEKNPWLTFRHVAYEDAEIDISWIREYGTGVLGQAYTTIGHVQIEMGDSNCGVWLPHAKEMLVDTIAHELLHGVGFDHVNNPKSIMYPEASDAVYEYESQEVSLGEWEYFAFPLCTNKNTTDYYVEIDSSDYGEKFDVFFVKSSSDVEKYQNGNYFNKYENCSVENVASYKKTCKNVSGNAGIIIGTPDYIPDGYMDFTIMLQEKRYTAPSDYSLETISGIDYVLAVNADFESERQNYNKAITLYKKILESNPNDTHALHNLGLVYDELGNDDKALEYYQKSLRLNSQDEYALTNIGTIMEERGQYEQALEYYQAAIEVNPEFVSALQNEREVKAKIEEGGGCLIATAAFGSEMAPQVQFLREIRDNTVLQTQSGTAFMTGFNQFYYSFSPYVADYERENPVFKEAVKVTLTPLLTSLTLLNYVDVDTEEEMLGYGIGIILLNIGMYFVAPAVLIVSLKKRLFI